MNDSDLPRMNPKTRPRRTRSANREQRIATRRKAIEQSPCRGICVINQTEKVCIGCFRTVAEITDWLDFDDQSRQDVLEQLGERETRFNK